MSQNLYVAILPPSDAVYDLRLACESVAATDGLAVAAREGRFWPTPVDEWHVTLTYLGDRPEGELPEVHEGLARLAARHSLFLIGLVAAGIFEGGVLWTGVGGARQNLIELANQARHQLNANRDYPYMPHLTLAKADESVDLAPLVAAMADYRGPAWWVDRIHLMRSGSGRELDHSIASWPLTGRS